ncbi:MAG: serine protease, partial [Pseudomonadota bacterium]|nr:serine protease [Pseudomonadota bacterium]
MLMRLLRPLPALAGAAIMFVTLDISAAERPDSFADQVEQLSPAVVNISTTTIVNDGPTMDMPQFP